MTFPVPGGYVTGHFDDPAKSGRNGIHAATDIGTEGAPLAIVAPERGRAFGWRGWRPAAPGKQWWPITVRVDDEYFPFANYFHDTYGCIVVLRSEDRERTHIFAHCFTSQVFNMPPFWRFPVSTVEEPNELARPIFGIATAAINVEEGDIIGHVGNAGISTGRHVHWEEHHGYRYNDHRDRIDPERWLRGEQV